MGDYMFNIGDFVTRNSYNNDIVFKIIGIQNDTYFLKGVCVRLYADSHKDDLVLYDGVIFVKYVVLAAVPFVFIKGNALSADIA